MLKLKGLLGRDSLAYFSKVCSGSIKKTMMYAKTFLVYIKKEKREVSVFNLAKVGSIKHFNNVPKAGNKWYTTVPITLDISDITYLNNHNTAYIDSNTHTTETISYGSFTNETATTVSCKVFFLTDKAINDATTENMEVFQFKTDLDVGITTPRSVIIVDSLYYIDPETSLTYFFSLYKVTKDTWTQQDVIGSTLCFIKMDAGQTNLFTSTYPIADRLQTEYLGFSGTAGHFTIKTAPHLFYHGDSFYRYTDFQNKSTMYASLFDETNHKADVYKITLDTTTSPPTMVKTAQTWVTAPASGSVATVTWTPYPSASARDFVKVTDNIYGMFSSDEAKHYYIVRFKNVSVQAWTMTPAYATGHANEQDFRIYADMSLYVDKVSKETGSVVETYGLNPPASEFQMQGMSTFMQLGQLANSTDCGAGTAESFIPSDADDIQRFVPFLHRNSGCVLLTDDGTEVPILFVNVYSQQTYDARPDGHTEAYIDPSFNQKNILVQGALLYLTKTPSSSDGYVWTSGVDAVALASSTCNLDWSDSDISRAENPTNEADATLKEKLTELSCSASLYDNHAHTNVMADSKTIYFERIPYSRILRTKHPWNRFALQYPAIYTPSTDVTNCFLELENCYLTQFYVQLNSSKKPVVTQTSYKKKLTTATASFSEVHWWNKPVQYRYDYTDFFIKSVP